MGKVGTWDYPDMKIEGALQIIEILDSQFNRKVGNMEAFAQALGHDSANSGAFFYKIADLRKYGLITSRGEITSTSLSDRLVHPNNTQERQEAIKEMVNNIAFFKKLYEVLGNKSADNNLHILLQDKFQIDRKEAQENAPKIRNIYNKILPYLSKGEKEPEKMGETVDSTTFTQQSNSAQSGTLTSNLSLPFSYNLYPNENEPQKVMIQFTLSKSHFVMAESIIKELEQKFEKKDKEKKD